jgi:serine/threonine-protein kinase TTK/MPS1
MMNSTTRLHRESGSRVVAEPLGEIGVYPIAERVMESENTDASMEKDDKMLVDKAAISVQASDSCVDAELASRECDQSKEQQECLLKETDNSKYASCGGDKMTKMKEPADVANVHRLVPKTSLDVKSESSKLEKREKAASSKGSSVAKKRSYDPDLFFKVNGKLYQRLGKIGSGGSSEVHKVISSDCRIYALKKIKLRGRDYATAYGFCQEIEYLNRLRGKDNIIQLIDYEVLCPTTALCPDILMLHISLQTFDKTTTYNHLLHTHGQFFGTLDILIFINKYFWVDFHGRVCIVTFYMF